MSFMHSAMVSEAMLGRNESVEERKSALMKVAFPYLSLKDGPEAQAASGDNYDQLFDELDEWIEEDKRDKEEKPAPVG